METIIVEKIFKLNLTIQGMTPDDGPADIEKAYSRMQKLLDQLRQKETNNPGYLMAWNLLVHYGKVELQDVQFYYQYTKHDKPSSLAKSNYEKAFIRFRDLIGMAVSMLPQS